MEELKETKTLQVLDVAPSDATKAFSRALQEKVQGVELKLTEKDQWQKENPVIFICNNNSRIKSDISPIINFIGDNSSKILLVIFHCKTLKRLPVISLQEELKNELPANIEIIEMGFNIHSKSNGIYNCDLNTKSCSRIEGYASESKVNTKDIVVAWIKKAANGFVNFVFGKDETRSKFETGTKNTDSNLDTLKKKNADNDDEIDKFSAAVSAKDVPEKLSREMTANNIANNQEDLVEINASTDNQCVDFPAKEASVEKPIADTTRNDNFTVKQHVDMTLNNISIDNQHVDMPGNDITYEKEQINTTAKDYSNKRQRVDLTPNDDTIEKQLVGMASNTTGITNEDRHESNAACFQ